MEYRAPAAGGISPLPGLGHEVLFFLPKSVGIYFYIYTLVVDIIFILSQSTIKTCIVDPIL